MSEIFIEGKRLAVSFSSTIKNLPFGASFEKNLKITVEVLEAFLKDSKANGFSQSYETRSNYSFNVCLCGDQKMKGLNANFRNKDKTTDVLTLALYEDIRAGGEFLFQEVELGDLFISSPVMIKQAKEFNITPEQEFFHLMIHGFLHLLGFDHEISLDEEKLMEKLEKKLIDKIYKKIF